MGRGPAVALVAVVMAIGAQSASAKDVQVAGPTPSGATLRVESGELCVKIVVDGVSHSSGCSETPRLPSDTELVESENRYVGGAAPPEVARVQAVQADAEALPPGKEQCGYETPLFGTFL